MASLSQMFIHTQFMSSKKPSMLWRPCSSPSSRTGSYSATFTNGGGLSYPEHCFPPVVQCEHPLLLVKTQLCHLSRRKEVWAQSAYRPNAMSWRSCKGWLLCGYQIKRDQALLHPSNQTGANILRVIHLAWLWTYESEVLTHEAFTQAYFLC